MSDAPVVGKIEQLTTEPTGVDGRIAELLNSARMRSQRISELKDKLEAAQSDSARLISEYEADVAALKVRIAELQHDIDRHIAITTEQSTAIAELEAAQAWVSVSELLPVSSAPVLAHYKNRLGKSRRIRGRYIAPHTLESTGDDDCDLDWSDDRETAWIKSGWYECMDNWEDYGFVSVYEGEVTEWMPLPSPPQESQ